MRANGPTRCCRPSADRPDSTLAVELAEAGILEKYGVKLIGASLRAIKIAEDRLLFKDACRKIGLEVPAIGRGEGTHGAIKLADQLGYPVVIRPSFTWGHRRIDRL